MILAFKLFSPLNNAVTSPAIQYLRLYTSNCRECGSDPWLGKLRSTKPCTAKTKTNKKKQCNTFFREILLRIQDFRLGQPSEKQKWSRTEKVSARIWLLSYDLRGKQSDSLINLLLPTTQSKLLRTLKAFFDEPPWKLLRLPRWLGGKESACNAGDAGSIPGSGRSPGGENGNPLQYSCLTNPRTEK